MSARRESPARQVMGLVAGFLGIVSRVALFVAIAAVGGLGSAWVMMHSGSRLSTSTNGPWVSWPQSGRVDADPYTRAHTVRLGLLPLNSSLGLTWHARNDDTGRRLHSSCEYRIEADNLDVAWWSISVFDDSGQLIRNAANRYAYNTTTAARDSDGGVTITLARDARPSNWLPTGGAGNLTLALFIQDARWSQQVLEEPQRERPLPSVKRVACR